MSREKTELRVRARALRGAMPADVRAAASAAICERILASPLFATCRTLLCYAPIGSEVDVLPVAKVALAQGKAVGFPICYGEEMEFYAVSALDELCEKDAFGIRIPAADESRPITPGGDTLMLMPGLAFDGVGNRIGYGKGYYDRYLHRTICAPITVGVTYAATLFDRIPAEAQDIPAAYLVTEESLHKCF